MTKIPAQAELGRGTLMPHFGGAPPVTQTLFWDREYEKASVYLSVKPKIFPFECVGVKVDRAIRLDVPGFDEFTLKRPRLPKAPAR
jgi:hypothetical protein